VCGQCRSVIGIFPVVSPQRIVPFRSTIDAPAVFLRCLTVSPTCLYHSRDRLSSLSLRLAIDSCLARPTEQRVALDDDWELVQQSIRATTDDVEKRKEIERSKRATQERINNGYDHGRPPFGLTYDDDGNYWVPDRDSEEYRTAVECIQLRENGRSWRAIADETDGSKDTARRIYERRERYLPREEVRTNG
jgi:hypothetical protein